MENTLISPVINPAPPGSRTGLQKVVIATKLDSIARDILLEDGNYEVVQDESGDLAALAASHGDTYALIVRSEKVTSEVIDAFGSRRLYM